MGFEVFERVRGVEGVLMWFCGVLRGFEGLPQGKEPGEHRVFLVVDVVVEIDWQVVQVVVDYVRHVSAWASCGAPVVWLIKCK